MTERIQTMALVLGHLSRVQQCTHAPGMKQGPNLLFPHCGWALGTSPSVEPLWGFSVFQWSLGAFEYNFYLEEFSWWAIFLLLLSIPVLCMCLCVCVSFIFKHRGSPLHVLRPLEAGFPSRSVLITLQTPYRVHWDMIYMCVYINIYINKHRKSGNPCGNCMQSLGKQPEQMWEKMNTFFQIAGQCLVLGSLLGS